MKLLSIKNLICLCIKEAFVVILNSNSSPFSRFNCFVSSITFFIKPMFISGSPPKKPIINLDLEGLILKMYFKKFMAKSVFMFLWFVCGFTIVNSEFILRITDIYISVIWVLIL